MSLIYDNIGLDEYLSPVNAPISTWGLVSAYDFDYQNERNVIHTTLVQQISADKIVAGTIAAVVSVGTSTAGTVFMDGPNNRFVVNDGTVDRIWIGNLTP